MSTAWEAVVARALVHRVSIQRALLERRAAWPGQRRPVPVTTKPKPILTVNETAELCNCHRDTVTNWIRSGKLRASKPGRLILIRLDDLHEMLAANPA